jgi:hypothetical protein
MQKPEPHSAAELQVVPLLLMHVPSCPFSAHDEPLGHVAVAQQTPSTQFGSGQEAALVHAVPSPSRGAHAVPLQ